MFFRSLFVCLFFSGINLLSGCGSGSTAGSSGGGPTPPSPSAALTITSLSNSSPSALSPLYISTSGLDVTQPVAAMVSNGAGYSAVLKPLRVQNDGTIVVAVPLFVDPATGKTNSLNASLTISQGSHNSAPVSLNIQDIPQLNAMGTTLGQVSRAFLNYQILAFARMLNALQAMQKLPTNKADTTAAQADILNQLENAIKARNDIDRIIVDNSLKIGSSTLPDGTAISFDRNGVEMMDRVLGVYLQAVLQPSLSSLKTASANPRGLHRLGKNSDVPNPTVVTSLKDITDAIGLVSNFETIVQAARAKTQADATFLDKTLASLSGTTAILTVGVTIVAGPEAAAGLVIAGAAFSAASIANDFIHIYSDTALIEKLSASGDDPVALAKAESDLHFSRINGVLDTVATIVGPLTVPAKAAAGLGQTVINFLEQQGLQAGIQTAGLLNGTAQLYFQNEAINDQKSIDDSAAQLASPFATPIQGFGTVAGKLNIANSQGPILSGLTEIVITDPASGTHFTAMAQQDGTYTILVPLGANINYSNLTISAVDLISGDVISSQTINLTNLNSQTVFPGPNLSGTCVDADADSPDSDDPDCD